MYQRIKNKLDVEIIDDSLKIDRVVMKRIDEIVAILDGEYGCCRGCFDLGGYILFFTDGLVYEKFAQKVMEFYHLDKDLYEYSELIDGTEDPMIEWHEELFLLSSDEAMILIYPTGSGGHGVGWNGLKDYVGNI